MLTRRRIRKQLALLEAINSKMIMTDDDDGSGGGGGGGGGDGVGWQL